MRTTFGRRLVDPALLRRVVYGAAGAGVMISMLVSVAYEPETESRVAALAVPLVVLASLPSRRWRSWVLAVGAGFVALWTPDAVFLWPAVSGLVLVSVAEDLHEVPVAGWVCGLVGSVGALVLYNDQATVAPFLAVALGGGLGLLVRALARAVELEDETETLRDQAAWLEQRTSLARELHDVVGHHVTAMVVQAEAGQVGDPQRALREIGELGRSALGELDSLVVHLRDPDAPLSVSAPPRLSDVDELLAATLRHQGVSVTVRVDPDLGLDDVTTLTAYRIAQEALTNVARHARASTVWVEVTRVGHDVRLRVSDDGVGPPPDTVRGSGLIGMQERVTARRGRWSLSERSGGGTVVDVFLPVAER
jgi:signal transduction histidine kinase